jgi:hypothetical protein
MSPFLGIKLGRRRDQARSGSVAATALGPGSGGRVPHGSTRTASLVELCTDLFSLAYSLRTTDDLGDPTELRRKILQLLDRIESEARKTGYSSAHVDGARFALVALIDEGILSSRWTGKTAWIANPLQKELFKMNIAGEKFYSDLEQLRQNREENRPLLEVYYASMGFGSLQLLGRELGPDQKPRLWLMHGSDGRWRNLSRLARPDDFPESWAKVCRSGRPWPRGWDVFSCC